MPQVVKLSGVETIQIYIILLNVYDGLEHFEGYKLKTGFYF